MSKRRRTRYYNPHDEQQQTWYKIPYSQDMILDSQMFDGMVTFFGEKASIKYLRNQFGRYGWGSVYEGFDAVLFNVDYWRDLTPHQSAKLVKHFLGFDVDKDITLRDEPFPSEFESVDDESVEKIFKQVKQQVKSGDYETPRFALTIWANKRKFDNDY